MPYERQDAFYPDSVLAQTHSGEFRGNINVFINIHGDPSREHLTYLVRQVFDLQAQYGGVLNRIDFGDKGCSLLLFWGAPFSYENDVQRALNFTLDLQDATNLSLRAGVTTSIAHTGFIGSELHEEYTCYGIGVNMSARLMTGAPWDSIWVDEVIGRQAGSAFDVEFEHKQNFKGFSEPQPVYVLLGRKHVDLESFYQGQLVGRDRELERLRRFADPLIAENAVERFAGMALITGDMGMGKSRLAHDFQRQLEQEFQGEAAPQWFICQTDPMLRQPLNPLRYWLRHYFEQSKTQSGSRNKRAFSRKLRQLIATVEDEAVSGRPAARAVIPRCAGRPVLGRLPLCPVRRPGTL